MNPVAMTIINPRKEYWPSRGSNQRPPVLKFATLRAVHDYCAIVALASVRGYIHGFLDTARHSRDRQQGDMPLQQSRQNGTTCHDKIVTKSRASVRLA